MDRKEWLKSLKIGDKVANKISYGWNRDKGYEFLEIKNITAKGNIRLTNGILLNDNGYYSKFEDWHSTTYKIEPITEEILQFEKNRRIARNLYCEIRELMDKFNKNNYTVNELSNIKKALLKENTDVNE